MAHQQAPDPWAHLKQRPRWRQPLDFGEPAETRKDQRRVPRLRRRSLWRVALEQRETGR